MPEEVLAGGNLNPVVRVGDTVRRATGAWTPAVHQLLKHLESHGLEAAPRVLGFDDQGREVLTFIEGDTDSSGEPGWVWSERALVEAARLIRRFHDLSRGFRAQARAQAPVGAQWQALVGAPTEGDIICHNDLAPYNTVFRRGDGVPIAFLDWDFAAPGTRLWDLAHAAWRFVPLYSDTKDRGWPAGLAERCSRLRTFCDAYGLPLDERTRLVDTIDRRIRCGLETLETWGRAGKPGWSEMWREQTHRDGALRDLAYINQHRREFGEALVEGHG